MKRRSRLYILDGTSGVWKQDLLNYTARRLSDTTTIRKLTTRNPRLGEDFADLDLDHVSTNSFEAAQPDYRYKYGGNWYGFTKSKLTAALRETGQVFVIVRNAGVIRKLKRDFADYCPTVAFVYVDSGLAKRKAQELSSALVRTSIHDAYLDYIRDPHLYDEVLIHGGESNDLYRLIDLLIARGLAKDLILLKAGKGLPIAIVTTTPTKRFVVILNSAILAAAIGIIVNLLTGASVGQDVALFLAGSVVLLAVVVNALFMVGWQRRRM